MDYNSFFKFNLLQHARHRSSLHSNSRAVRFAINVEIGCIDYRKAFTQPSVHSPSTLSSFKRTRGKFIVNLRSNFLSIACTKWSVQFCLSTLRTFLSLTSYLMVQAPIYVLHNLEIVCLPEQLTNRINQLV